jgi:hypothetical protein
MFEILFQSSGELSSSLLQTDQESCDMLDSSPMSCRTLVHLILFYLDGLN